MILLAVRDPDRDAALRDLLTAEGYWVTTARTQAETVRATADHAPRLLIIDADLADATSLLEVLQQQEGGPATLILVDERGDFEAQQVLLRGAPKEVVLDAVRGRLDAPRPRQSGGTTVADEQLTTSDLFGDILVGLGEAEDGDGAIDATTDASGGEREGPGEVTASAEEHEAEEPAESEEEPEAAEPEPAGPETPQPGQPESREADSEGEETVDREPQTVPASEVAPEPETSPDAGDPGGSAPVEGGTAEDPTPEDGAAKGETVEVSQESETGEVGDLVVESGLPEIAVAGTDVSEVEAPEVEAPEVEAPEVEAPEVEAPKVEAPEVGAAEVEAPEVEPPEVEAPGEAEAPHLEIERRVEDLLSGHIDDRVIDEPSPRSLDEVLALADDSPAVAQEGVEESDTGSEDPGTPAADVRSGADGRERVGEFELLELLEFSEYVERWRARRTGEGKDGSVLIERLRPEYRGRSGTVETFVQGNSLAASIGDPRFLEVVDLGRAGDVDYVAVEEVPGQSLQEVIHRVRRMEGRVPLGIAMRVAEQVGRALQAIGERSGSSRHGRLVATSVWLAEDGRVLLRDFGAERSITDHEPAASDWAAWRFIAPEAWQGQSDLRSDLFSLGALVYEMVTGRPIREADTLKELEARMKTGSIAPAQEVDPTLPTGLHEWVMELLAPNPADRPEAMSKVLRRLERLLEELPARPGDREVAAYLRQLSAARVPAAQRERLPLREELPPVSQPAGTAAARSGGGFDARWWWWIAALLGLAAGYLLFMALR